ncbi:MAG: selenocysteine-specific translation elongation factor [Candidatus Cloacimonadota bacterium]|nr:selenocysteine-specific translation elongation factor [Candidatus Cloacimonadota bacterium]
MNKHIIMGTAGHVDHGKTTLIKNLTGYDCDTHKQEKKRGITINLGFTHIDLPNSNSVSIVDVPGHKDFINTMISGASGIDFVMLVIAADDGVMPQTYEHLNIMQHLGIKHGFIALTKTDLVDKELVELASLEIEEFIEGTFLEGCNIIPVSKDEPESTKKVISEIEKFSNKVPERDIGNLFRMYIDRIFTVKGFGTIVNGSVLSGSISSDEELFLEPEQKKVRIRRIEKHGTEAKSIIAGDRASINAVGLQKSDFHKGSALLSKKIEPTNLIDAKVELFDKNVKLKLWNQALFLFGTVRQMVKIHLLNKNNIEGNESGIIQIYFDSPIITLFGDRFILRNSSGDTTIGAGEVIDPHPLHHRRRHKKDIQIVEKIAEGDENQIIVSEVYKSVEPVRIDDLFSKLNISKNNFEEHLNRDSSKLYIIEIGTDKFLFPIEKGKKLRREIITKIKNYNKQNPLLPTGLKFKELLGIFKVDIPKQIHNNALKGFLKLLEEEKIIKKSGNSWVDYKHKIKIDEATQKLIESIKHFVNSNKFTFVDMIDIANNFSNNSDKKIHNIVSYLIQKEVFITNQKAVILKKNFDIAIVKLVDYIKKNKAISAAQFRDIMKINRKNAILFLEFCDQKNITIRLGNERKLSKKFRDENSFTK